MRTHLSRRMVKLVSPSGRRGKVSVFIFHRVLAERDPLFPDDIESRDDFDRILRWVGEWFNVIPLADAARCIEESKLPERVACITFDDGYADNFLYALPALRKHDMHATFFVATGFLDGGLMWNDQIIEATRATTLYELDAQVLGLGMLQTASLGDKRATLSKVIPALKHRLPSERAEAVQHYVELCNVPPASDLMMTSIQVKKLRDAGMEIGAHTVSHPILASCSTSRARAEMADSRDFLEGLLGERVRLFAYPNGKLGADYTMRDVSLVKELGFDAAVSTNPGASKCGDDIFQIRRFTPWDRQKWRFFLRSIRNIAMPN